GTGAPSHEPSGSVHPHSRGERVTSNSAAISTCGSSPLAWGEGWRGSGGSWRRRFIPTRVGRGPASSPPSAPRAVHPHSRGERVVVVSVVAPFLGSSPLAWGEGWRGSGGSWRRRFIPTRVGRGRSRPRGRA